MSLIVLLIAFYQGIVSILNLSFFLFSLEILVYIVKCVMNILNANTIFTFTWYQPRILKSKSLLALPSLLLSLSS